MNTSNGSFQSLDIPSWTRQVALSFAALCLLSATTWAVEHRDISDYTTETLIPRYHAIVIGINHYEIKGPAGWDSLRTAEQDAQAVAQELESRYQFQVTRLLGSDATRERIMAELDQLATASPQDAFVIYFAGHGNYDENLDEGFWIPVDARASIDGRPAREDWIWNAVLTRMFSASQARHILVLADSCYGGSLFRGPVTAAPATKDLTWYVKALCRPSRYVITSGDYEPVLDSGARHSVFAQLLLHYLQYNESGVFSASELGLALRDRVAEITGQMVRMGPLSLPSHAGGEFVFLGHNTSAVALTQALDQLLSNPIPILAQAPNEAGQRTPQQIAMDAALLEKRGATNSAMQLLSQLDDTSYALQMRSAIQPQQAAPAADPAHEIRNLISHLSQLHARAGDKPARSTDEPRPRIIAVMDADTSSESADVVAESDLFTLCLISALSREPGVRVVERKALEKILRELEISSSDLSDAKTRLEWQRLVPAATLLYPQVIRAGTNTSLTARLLSTETSDILWAEAAPESFSQQIPQACAWMVRELMARYVSWSPLKSSASLVGSNEVRAAMGSFQKITPAMVFHVVGASTTTLSASFIRRNSLGVARPSEIGTTQSLFEVQWTVPPSTQQLWLVEQPAE
jgi:TolB-like protein